MFAAPLHCKHTHTARLAGHDWHHRRSWSPYWGALPWFLGQESQDCMLVDIKQPSKQNKTLCALSTTTAGTGGLAGRIGMTSAAGKG
eukprot:2422958-Amphidinium_carterae.3